MSLPPLRSSWWTVAERLRSRPGTGPRAGPCYGRRCPSPP
jgi:hypothetical protein